MRIPIILLLTTLLFSSAVDFYIYKVAKKRCCSDIPARIQKWSALILYLFLVIGICLPMRSGDGSVLLVKMWVLFAYLTILIPKLIFVLFDLIGRIPVAFDKKRLGFLSVAGGVFAFITFCAMWWGALVNRYGIDLKKEVVEIPDLPVGFDNYRIAQISDLHVGTFGSDSEYLEDVVNYVNELQPDLIVFTGDLVNRKTDELLPFVRTLSGLKANDGVISILGNHDYGDYFDWTSEDEKSASLKRMVDIQKKMSWTLLLNDHIYIRHGSDSIAVIGVENVGDPPFKIYGDLKASYPDLSDNVTKILLSHNPVHWSAEIADNPDVNIALTLSGHTHAMQIEIGGVSPAAFRYDNWGGMYSDDIKWHSLYVNIGLGTVGLPMRLGATPEVTLFTLKRGGK